MLDLVLVGGAVIDGTGRQARRADVGIAHGEIVTVADLTGSSAARTIRVAGLVIAPGFIDTHAHTDLAYLLEDGHLDIKSAGLRQGVTTEVTGNCGFSPFPAPAPRVDPHEPYRALFPRGAERYFATLAAYRERFAGVALPLNIAPLVGHGRIRSAVMGGAARPASRRECGVMTYLADEAVADGAFGLSSGLAYAPGVHARTSELVAAVRHLGANGLPYVTHLRDEGDHVMAAMAEAIEIGRAADVSVHISHHKLAGRGNWGGSARTLALIDQARRGGQEVTLDVYPYTAGSTLLADILPPWMLADSGSAMRERLADRRAVARLAMDFERGLPGWQNLVGLCGWSEITLAGQRWAPGSSVAALAANAGVSEACLVAGILREDPTAIVIIEMMDAGDVEAIAAPPFAMTGSDGIPVPGAAHPRIAGTFARTLAAHRGDPVRLAEAVRKMTSLPAARFKIPRRGVVAPGYVADLVVFDDSAVTDRATYAAPLLPPAGIEHVIIAGRQVVRDGQLTAERPGQVLQPS